VFKILYFDLLEQGRKKQEPIGNDEKIHFLGWILTGIPATSYILQREAKGKHISVSRRFGQLQPKLILKNSCVLFTTDYTGCNNESGFNGDISHNSIYFISVYLP